VLLFAQAVALVHKLDPHSFEPDHACEICVMASVLGGANVATGGAPAIVPSDHAVTPAAHAVLVSTEARRPSARAPPIAS
jgi:hypothetical protein